MKHRMPLHFPQKIIVNAFFHLPAKNRNKPESQHINLINACPEENDLRQDNSSIFSLFLKTQYIVPEKT